MTRIADLLDRDLSTPVEEFTKVSDHDPDTVLTELTEYIATDLIKSEYERLFSAIAAAPKSPHQTAGVWISGFSGCGKSSFAKNVGYVLANREVKGTSASSLFLKQEGSKQVAEHVEFLNRTAPYEIFLLDVQSYPSLKDDPEQIAEVMYQLLLRDLDYAGDHDIAELEIELEKLGKLETFEDLCRAEYTEDRENIREGSQNVARASALLHRLDPRTYASADTWLNRINARPARRLSVKDLVNRSFDLCEVRRPGKAFAFILDEIGEYVGNDGERLEKLLDIVERFGRQSLERLKTGKIPGPVWIIVTAQERLQEVCDCVAADGIDLSKAQDCFKHQIDLSSAGIREVAAHRVLRKKESQEYILRHLFQEQGASLIQKVKLERCSRPTEFDEGQFVQFYPYLPHLIDLSIDILAGLRLQPNAPRYLGSSNRTIVKQAFEMLMSEETRLADQPVGILVSIDKIYELVEGNTPWEKQKDILDIRQLFDSDKDYPGTASRVAKAICLMELAKTDLPRTTKNIAALLVQRVNDAPPIVAVAGILERLKAAQFVRETEDGWKLYDYDDLRREAATLERLRKAVGTVNPRASGWHNGLIQLVKKMLARALTWYVRPIREFNASVSRSLDEIVGALDHLSVNAVAFDRLSMNMDAFERISMNMVAFDRRINTADKFSPQLLDHLSIHIAAIERMSMDMLALQGRSAHLEARSAAVAKSMQKQLELLRDQVKALASLQNVANPEALVDGLETEWDKPARENARFSIDTGSANYRTAYVIGLFGTGRRYINEFLREKENIGERAKYFRDAIRLHPGPTPMIYSGHATTRYASRAQETPAVMKGVLEAVRSGFADLIFLYRHPLDSLLTNWIWWRAYIRSNRWISGISEVYKNPDDLYADLDRHFLDFKAFAEGDPQFFAGVSGPRFLSFAEFVEETEIHLQSCTLKLRLEDFAADPLKEFSKVVQVIAVDHDLSQLRLAPPRSSAYGYLIAMQRVPRFRNFVNELSKETKSRLEQIGYNVGA
jgi:hypothetical protein